MSSNSSNSSKGGCNTETPPSSETKQISPAKRWYYTLNNWTEEEHSSISSSLRDNPNVLLAIHEWEIGEECQTPHLQGYVEFKTKVRPRSIGLTKRIHWGDKYGKCCKQPRDICVGYCSKDNNVIFSYGLPKPLKLLAETNMYEYQRYMCQWALQEPDDRKILWLYGGKNIGKTQALKVLCNPEGKYQASILPVSKKHALAQVQRCELCETFVFNLTADESQYQTNSMFSIIESLKDGLFSTAFGTDNNSMCVRNSSNVIVVANQPPDGSKTEIDRDRFEIWEVSSSEMIKKPTSIMDDFKYDKCILSEDELMEKY